MNVKSRDEAQRVIAELLLQFSGDTAYSRMRDLARFAHQGDQETAWRAAGNLLTSFNLVRPLGE